MFSHRRLFLAVTMLASIVLADILVQPGYQHQSPSDLRYLQPHVFPQYQSPAEQYHPTQLRNQESARYLVGAQNDQTYQYEDGARSNLLRYPHRLSYHNYHYLPRPHHLHYAKIGGHGYVRPSVILGYPEPVIVHNRYKRSASRRSDPTSGESSKSESVAHDNDVAAKSTLTDAENPTAIDSLLPEHEPANTNDKRVENRQVQNDQVMKPRLFGLYPENMYSTRRLADKNPYHSGSSDPYLDWMLFPSTPATQAELQESVRNQTSYLLEAFLKTFNQDILKPKVTAPIEKSPKVYKCIDTSDMAVTTTSAQSPQFFVDPMQNRYRNNEKASETHEIFGSLTYDKFGKLIPNIYSFLFNPYRYTYTVSKCSNDAPSYSDPNKKISNVDNDTKPIKISDYVLYTNTNTRSNPTPTVPQTQMQFLDMYNYPPEKKIQAASSDYEYYDNAYPSDALYDTFSSPVYY